MAISTVARQHFTVQYAAERICIKNNNNNILAYRKLYSKTPGLFPGPLAEYSDCKITSASDITAQFIYEINLNVTQKTKKPI